MIEILAEMQVLSFAVGLYVSSALIFSAYYWLRAKRLGPTPN